LRQPLQGGVFDRNLLMKSRKYPKEKLKMIATIAHQFDRAHPV
jgi:hypothetical protein